jgi:hypothetical protein
VLFTSGITSTLSNSYFVKGQTIKVQIWAYDGTENSTTSISSSTTIVNYIPQITVEFNRTMVFSVNDLGLNFGTWFDADTQDQQFKYIEWEVNGQSITQLNNASKIGSQWFSVGQFIKVRFTPNDGQQNGTTQILTITVSYPIKIEDTFAHTMNLQGDNALINFTLYSGIVGDQVEGYLLNPTATQLTISNTTVNPTSITLVNATKFLVFDWGATSTTSGRIVWYFDQNSLDPKQIGQNITLYSFDGTSWQLVESIVVDWAKGTISFESSNLSQIKCLGFCIDALPTPPVVQNPIDDTIQKLLPMILGGLVFVASLIGIFSYSRRNRSMKP